MKYKKVMIFGVFDGLHDGHSFFIEKAKKYGKELIVVVATDENVKKIKNKFPKNKLDSRINRIKKVFPNLNTISGDVENNSWHVLHDQKPDLIVLGYDQENLSNILEKEKKQHNFDLHIIKEDHHGDVLHSSLLQ